jgi:ribonuclease D
MQTFPEIRSVDSADAEHLPLTSFEGIIHIITSIEQVHAAVKYLQTCSKLGFDTETRPSFKKGLLYPLSLLQLSTESHAFLFRLQYCGLPKELCDILALPSIIKVGAAIHDDVAALQKITKFKPQGFIDLQTIAKQLEIENFGLKKLAQLVLGIRISKRQQLSNWDSQKLTESQCLYAATDAWVSLEIYKKLETFLHDTTIS